MEPDEPKKHEGEIMHDLSIIQAVLDRMAARLATPGTRGLEAIRAEQETITGTIRQAVQTDSRTIYRIAADAGISKAALGKFVKGEKDLNGATLDKLAAAMGLVLTEKPRNTPKKIRRSS